MVSCYTITHNPRPSWLKKARESAKVFDEYILVDDGSDVPVEGATFRFNECQGIVAARNKAISLCKGDWIAMIDDDDYFLPERVLELKAMLPDINADIISFPVEFFGIEQNYWPTSPDMSRILFDHQIPAGSWFKRKVWEKLKYQLYPAEDWDFWARAVKCKFRFAHADKPMYRHRVRKGSASDGWVGEKFIEIRKAIIENYHKQI